MIRVTLLPLILAACGQGDPAVAGADRAAKPEVVEARAVPRWDAARCGKGDVPDAGDRRHRVFAGFSPDQLLAAYGKAAGDERFRVGGPGGVFYGALGKMPPGRAHLDTGKPARVLTWTRSGCELHVFFVERGKGWVAVQALESAAGADY